MPDPIVILGAGATGLTAAYLAAKAGHTVVVLEGSDKFGGLLETFPVGDTRLEHYYHHFFTHDAEIQWLIRELGIDHHLRFLPATMGIFRDQRHWDFNGPRDLLHFDPLSLPAKLRFGLSSLFLGKVANWQNWEDVPALEWFYRYAGRAATDAIWRPMLAIKFGPYADRVPVAWMVGRLRQRMGSRKQGDERLGYLDGSLQTLLDALLDKLHKLGVRLVREAKATSFDIREGRIVALRTTAGEFAGQSFLATIPTVHLAPLLREAAPKLAHQLGSIEYFGAVCTILELDRALSQTYWLNVADPGFPFGGVIEHTNLIPPERYGGRHIVYLSRYFEAGHPLANAPQQGIAGEMIHPLTKIYPNFRREHIQRTSVFRTLTAATVCDLGFSRKVPAARTLFPNLFIASMAHVYPDERSCNNSIRVAAEACRVMNLDTATVPRHASLSGKIGMS
jgi:protoporphyrinogen oxidase